MHNKGNITREFEAGEIVILKKQVKSCRKYGLAQESSFITKGTYGVLEKASPSSYWLQRLKFFEGIGRNIIKVKESVTSMENIPPTMVPHKHVDGTDTIFDTTSGPLVKNL